MYECICHIDFPLMQISILDDRDFYQYILETELYSVNSCYKCMHVIFCKF